MEYYTAIIGYGDDGDDTLFLQRQLHLCGFNPGEKDGIFRDGTGNAVEDAQIYFGIPADRIAGLITWRKLYDYGAKIQMQLNAKGGYGLEIDGNVGSHGMTTVNAFMDFQRKGGREPDWCCGPEEERHLDMVDYMRATAPGCGETNSGSTIITPETSGVLNDLKFYVIGGHGGSDGGAYGHGMKESDIALDYSKRLGALIQANGGSVLLGRTGDYYKSLASRVTEANNWGADYYISCHINGFDNPAACGAEVLYISDAGRIMAQEIVNQLAGDLGVPNRGPKSGDYYEVVYSNAYAVINEPGFITNPSDAAIMATENGRHRIANNILVGLQRAVPQIA